MAIRPEVMPFLLVSACAGALVALAIAGGGAGRALATAVGGGLGFVLVGFCAFFFRDPERTPPADDSVLVSGADGVVAQITEVNEDRFLKTNTVRISVFLSLMDVHVNRAPMAGTVTFAQYYPGKKLCAFKNEASDENQHSAIVFKGRRTSCLVSQIVGLLARRVVFWLNVGQDVAMGERIGMMKFGSRLDIYFPREDVSLLVKEGDRVVAGKTIIARVKEVVRP